MARTVFADKNIIWHPEQHYTYSQYHNALDDVFESLWFKDASLRFILIGSYRMNLRHMVLYALNSGIDEIEFIQSLRQVLLEMPGCVDLER